jgi:hypothetical protein
MKITENFSTLSNEALNQFAEDLVKKLEISKIFTNFKSMGDSPYIKSRHHADNHTFKVVSADYNDITGDLLILVTGCLLVERAGYTDEGYYEVYGPDKEDVAKEPSFDSEDMIFNNSLKDDVIGMLTSHPIKIDNYLIEVESVKENEDYLEIIDYNITDTELVDNTFYDEWMGTVGDTYVTIDFNAIHKLVDFEMLLSIKPI